VTLTEVAAIAGGGIVVLLAVFEGLARWVGGSFMGSVVLGADGRTSTSKTFVFLWTLLVAWALIALLIAGQFLGTRGCVIHPHPLQACKKEQLALLQLGWHHFLKSPLSGSYLVLLGIPGVAAITAKGITQASVNGGGFKKPKPKPDPARASAPKSQDSAPGAASKSPAGPQPVARVTEIFSADDGTTDIGDFQYVIFNLITAVYFVTQFLHPDGTGLPTIPNTLLGLTGVSASVYLGKKAVTDTQPTVTGVFPLPLHDGQRFTVIGTGLTQDPGSPTDADPQITIDGLSAEIIDASGDNLRAKAPPNISVGGAPIVRKLRVLNPYGGITADFDVQCL
jgi:hypothetical protein